MKTTGLIRKRDAKQQLVLVPVYVPNDLDAQGEFCTASTLEKAAHEFNANGHQRNLSIMHDGEQIDGAVVESFIAMKHDPLFEPGSWIVVLKIDDESVWQAIKDGSLTGVSFEGEGTIHDGTLNGKPAKELRDLSIHTLSIVDRPANRRTWTMLKSETELTAVFAAIAEQIAETNDAIREIAEQLAEQDEKLAGLTQGADGRVYKSHPINRNGGTIERLLRKRQRAQKRLDEFWERPDLYPDTTEAELRRAVTKAEDKLYAYGHQAPAAGLDTNSAFFERGGTSNFLVASSSPIDDLLGISRATRELQKSVDEVEVENCLVL